MTAFALLITPAPLLFLNPEFVYLNGLELISSPLARAREETAAPRHQPLLPIQRLVTVVLGALPTGVER